MKRPMLQLSRKHVILTAASVLVLLLGYSVWSVWQWNQYDANADARLTSAEQTVVSTRAISDTQASANVKMLRAASGDLKDVEEVCSPHWTIAWQTILPSQREKVEDCKQAAAKYAKTRAAIDTVVAFLDTEQQVLGALSGLKSTKKLTDKTWDDTITLWQTAAVDLDQLQASDEYMPVLTALKAQLQEVIDAWKQLKKADKAEKRTNYESAYGELDQAITGMVDIADKSDKILRPLLSTIETTQD